MKTITRTMLAATMTAFLLSPATAILADDGISTEPTLAAASDQGETARKKKDRKKGAGSGSEKKGKKEKNDAKKPFAEVIKDAEAIEGLFTIYKKEDRYLLELKPEHFEKDYMVSLTRESGLGQWFILATMVLGENPIRFHKVEDKVQLLLRNARFTAVDDPDARRAVEKSFSDSLVGSAKIESEPHPETKALLVDMKSYFINDVEDLQSFFGNAFRAAYQADGKNSYLEDVKAFPMNLEVESRMHFRAKKQTRIVNLPDDRSLFINYRYSITDMPAAEGYVPRLADDRVGHFLTLYQDFSNDRRESPYVRYVTRWDLRKQDPDAEMSPPVTPITFWLENSIPKRHREAVAEGVLLWNKAFEEIGFENAVVVKQQPDDTDWDPADARYSTVRWFITTTGAFAIGPSRINPMTGQIYDADIGVADSIVRFTRSEWRELVDPVGSVRALANEMLSSGAMAPAQGALVAGASPRFGCSFARGAAQQASFGHQLLMARGMEPGSPEEEQYVRDFLVHVIAHEVGHTLGLRHNFRASTIHPVDQLQNTDRTMRRGLTGSVMDYTPVNIAPVGGSQGQHWQTTLGEYDMWAIEYAYRQFPDVEKPEDEIDELARIAKRGTENGHAFGSHEDMGDPRTNMWDIGADSIEYYGTRIALARELWEEIPENFADEGEGYQVMRRVFQQGMGEFIPAAVNLTKYVGGIYNYRDHVGDPDGRLPFEPVPSDMQRRAMSFLREQVFDSRAFDQSPDLLNKLAAPRFWDFSGSMFRLRRLEYPLHDVVLSIQTLVLDQLVDPVKLDRLVDMEMHYSNGDTPFTMFEMFDGLQRSIWSEIYGPSASRIGSFRRGLQRAHLDRAIELLNQPEDGVPEDAATTVRANLMELTDKIAAALGSSTIDAITRAHLEETRATIEAALSARMKFSQG